jgi:hypothetical protein
MEDSMKQYRGLILFIATMVSLFVLVQVWHLKSAPEEQKLEQERKFQAIAIFMNVNPPQMPDDSVRLGRVTYDAGVLHIPYTLTEMTKSEIDVAAFKAERKPPLVTASCDEKGLGQFVKMGLIVNYTFSDSSDALIDDVKVGKSECE